VDLLLLRCFALELREAGLDHRRRVEVREQPRKIAVDGIVAAGEEGREPRSHPGERRVVDRREAQERELVHAQSIDELDRLERCEVDLGQRPEHALAIR
jgi:hypothetical protein